VTGTWRSPPDEDEPKGRAKEPPVVRLWVTDDARALPLKLECKLPYGLVRAELIEQKSGSEAPRPAPPAPRT